jgi:hypothetical protein
LTRAAASTAAVAVMAGTVSDRAYAAATKR